MGLAGLATDIQTFHKKIQYKLKMYQLRENRKMKPETFAKLVGTTLYEHRFGPFICTPCVVGLQDGKPIIYDYDSIGTQSHSENFAYVGTSGDNFASLCEGYYRKGLTPEELEDIMANILVSGLDRDVLSGWGGIVYVLTDEGLTAKLIETKMI